MQSWKTILIIGSLLACLVPSAAPQTGIVTYSISFSAANISLDVSGNVFNYYAPIQTDRETLFEFEGEIKGDGSFVYNDSTNFSDNLRILTMEIYVDWEIENWTLQNDFTVSAFGMSKSSSNNQSGEMFLTWFGNESLLDREWAIGEGDNESHFESTFFKSGPDFDIALWFEEGSTTNISQVNYSVSVSKVTWEFPYVVAGGTNCLELLISNEGTASIDVDVAMSGGGVTISPGAFSVTLAAGASITVPVCATALLYASYKIVQVTALASGRESNTQQGQVNKNGGFTVSIQQYALLSIRADQPHQEVCQGEEFPLSFTVINYGNYVDTILLEILNQEELEEAGFIVALSQPQIEIDSQGEMAVPLNIRAGTATEIVEEGNYTLVIKAGTTLAGETEAQNATATLDIVECGEIVDPVEPGTPVAIAGNAVTVKPGETVQFNGAGTDEDGEIVLYEWDFNNDGVYEWSSEENGRITNIYNKEGTYAAVLRVTDDDGRTATDSRVITVGDGGGDDSDEGFLPAPSLAAAVAAVAVIALRRPRKP